MPINAGTVMAYLDLDTGKFSQKLGDARKQTEGFGDGLKNYGNLASDVGKGLTLGLTAPIVGIGVAATNTALDFEAGMSRVQAIAGATKEELGLLSDQALQLGADTAFSASESAAGMENLASAGFSVEEIMLAMPGLLDLAAVSGGNVGVSAEVAANAIRGFGLEASEAGHVADVFARAAADTNAEVADMGEAMKYVAPVANAFGISIEETAAAVGILSDAGIKGGQAGTVLRGALTRLVNPSEKAWEKINELGMSFFDLEGKMLPLEGVIEEVKKGTEGLTEEVKNQALAQIFGQEALSGMLTLIETGPEKLSSLTKSFEESDGAAASMAETILDNGKGSIEEMMGALETAGIKIGNVIIPIITTLADKVGELADWFNGLDEETQKSIIKMAGLAAAAGPVLLVGGKMASGLGSIIGLFKTFSGGAAVASTAVGVTGTGLGAGLIASVTTFAPWIAGIAGLVIAGKSLANHLKEETVPAVELFDETISESTKEVLGNFLKMSDEAVIALDYLGKSGTKVSEELYLDMTTNTNQMADEVIAKLEEQKVEGLRILEEYLDSQTEMTLEEKEEALKIATEKYDNEILKATEGKARIEEILLEAKEKNRKITDDERVEIEEILEDLKEASILTMTESKEEQEKILENLKKSSERLSAEQMAGVVANSIEQKKKTIEEAEEQYEKVLASAQLLKKDGSAESIALADKMISEAKRQKDGTIAEAEEMHEKVLGELKAQGGDLFKQIDTDNGKIKTKWDELSDWFNRNPIVRWITTKVEEGADRDNGFNRTLGRNAQGTNYWRGGLTWVGEQGPEIIELPRGSKVHNNQDSMAMTGGKMEHTGTIKVIGVNNNDELVGVVDMVMEQLRREVRS